MNFDTGALFDTFVSANTLKTIQQSFLQLCTALEIDPSDSPNVYPSLRRLKDWKAEKLWKLLDKRYEQTEYRRQQAATRLNTLVIGAGPCGLRAAIECALLGSRVVLLEQREKFSRNNVLHLWAFVIHDIKALGAKIFYPKFCTGSIEHISIRQLQCILLKVALCFGVQIHEGVSFNELIFPEHMEDGSVTGFRASVEPRGHILSEFEIDVLIGADGKRNTVPGFRRKEMRGKLAIAITANFVNNRTSAEERVPEISGVAYIFNQSFFKEMYATTGVDLENIVYYKDDTHYFVMCAKKQSLMDMGVIKEDFEDVSSLLAWDNLDRDALCNYARAAANFATHDKLPSLEFAKNHRGQEDIAAFDFTSLYSSRCSVRLVERKGKRLLMGIVGDSLHEPFWPTGSGIARGFLGVFDTAWLIREYGLNQRGPLQMIAERESVYRLLAQVTKDNMHKIMGKYTIDPRTRYVSLEMSLDPDDVAELINSDHPRELPVSEPLPLNNASSVHDVSTRQMLRYALWRFCCQALTPYKLKLFDLDYCWRDGRALGGLVAKFRPDCLDYFSVIAIEDITERLTTVFAAILSGFGVSAPCDPQDWPSLSEGEKLSFIGRVVVAIREDPTRLCKALVTPRSSASKRKVAPPQMTISRRKTQPIEKLAQDLLGCSSFHPTDHPVPVKRKDSREVCARHKERLERLSRNDSSQPGPAALPRQSSTGGKTDQYASRPQVDRLDPQLVNKVEKIVSGELLKEREVGEDSDRKADKTHRLDRSNLHNLEQKLIATGLGLVNQNKPEHISSQDEKIMRVSAADARREAAGGFQKEAETERFKKYDETIRKSEEALKKRDLTGVDPFGKWRVPPPTAAVAPLRTAPPPTPPKTAKPTLMGEEEVKENGVVARPTVPVYPKRHSVPVVESCYDSVNSRKQTNCQLCNKVVYLAERMQVESMFIHKQCFRCAYCSQPLRLGEYGKDKDLEYHYPKKFFCNIHLRVPLREKIAGIERAARKLERAASRDRPEPPPLPPTAPPTVEKGRERRATLSFFSSPELPQENTSVKRNEMGPRSIISPVSELSSIDDRTPERAEFGSHIRKSSVVSTVHDSKATLVHLSSVSDSEDEEPVLGTGAQPSSSNESSDLSDDPSHQHENGEVGLDEEEEDESLSDSDGLEEEELAELETSVLQLMDENPQQKVTDEQIKTVIDKINQRRTALQTGSTASPSTSFAATPEREKVNLDETQFFTPSAVMFRKPDRDTPTRDRARTIAAMPTDDDFQQFNTPSAEDIRKQKTVELEKLRSESKMRAQQKSDAELGISGVRYSVPTFNFSTPLSSRSQTVSPPRDRPRASSLLNEMPSSRREWQQPSLPTLAQSPPPLEVKTVATPSQVSHQPTDQARLPTTISSGQGMLSQLFSPDQIRKKSPTTTAPVTTPIVNAERVHCESRKETSILGNAFRRLKLRRESGSPTQQLSPSPSSSRISVTTGEQQPRVAAIPPSPRVLDVGNDTIERDPATTSSQISLDQTTLKQFHRRAEKIIRQRDESLAQSAQELQRLIEHNEIRLDEIRRDGQEHERRLKQDPCNKWELECWLALVRERDALSDVQKDHQLKLRKMELHVRYRELNARFAHVQSTDEMADPTLLADMLAVVNEKNRVDKELADTTRIKFKRPLNPDTLLAEKNHDFRNFSPIFC